MITHSYLARFDAAIGPNGEHWFTGRPFGPPRWIVIHGTAGGSSAQEVANYFQSDIQNSSHYIIGQDGTIIQCVDESDSAWANGVFHSRADEIARGADPWWQENGVNPNFLTISIEHVKAATNNSSQLTPEQENASFRLIEDICDRWNIPREAATASGGITTHSKIDPIDRTYCPGPYPFDALWAFLNPMPILPSYAHDVNGAIHYDGNPHIVQWGFREAILAGVVPFMGPPSTDELEIKDSHFNGTGNEGHAQFFMYGCLVWDKVTNQIFAVEAGALLLALCQKLSSFDALTANILGPAA